MIPRILVAAGLAAFVVTVLVGAIAIFTSLDHAHKAVSEHEARSKRELTELWNDADAAGLIPPALAAMRASEATRRDSK